MAPESPEQLQRRCASVVLANRLTPEPRWGRPCLAYFACVRPAGAEAAAFAQVQDAIAELEPSLLRVPRHALHTSVTWLLPAHEEFCVGKDELWRSRGPRWRAALTAAAAGMAPFRLSYRRLVATESAVIAVAEHPDGHPNGLTELRSVLAGTLDVPGSRGSGDLVHTTLFRYGGPLRDPAALLRGLASADVRVDVDVTELVVLRENVFPSLEHTIAHRCAVGG